MHSLYIYIYIYIYCYLFRQDDSKQMRDQQFNNCLVVYIKKDVADSIDNETIIQRFQNKIKKLQKEILKFLYI